MSFKNLHTSGMTISFSNAPSFKVLFFLLFCFSLNTSFAQDCDNLTDGGTISGDEAGCNNPTFDPSTIISTAPATGGTGNIQYMWMRTTGDPNSPFNTWQIIPGATGESYDPDPISQTTHYGRCSRRSSCTEYIGETNFVTKTISCCSFNSTISPLASTICPKETLPMSVTATGTGLSYLWEASGGSFDNPSITNPNYTMMMPGIYTIKVTISSVDCTEMIETTVIVDNSLTASITANQDYVEVNENLQLNSTVSDVNVTYDWTATSGTFNNNTIANPTYSNANAGNAQIFLTVSNPNGCTAVDTFDIGIGACALAISGITTEASCTGNDGTITITPTSAIGTINYQWSQASIGNTATPTGLAAGNYTVTATDEAGCTANTTVTIIGSASNIVVTPTVTAASCGESNGAISLNITGGTAPYVIQWDNGLGNTPNLTGLAAGNYNVSVSDANGCSTSVVVTISEVEGISIMVISTPISCIFANDATAVAMIAGATGAVSYAWSSNLGNSAMVTGLPPGTYTVTATDEAGCSATESVTIVSPAVLTAQTTTTSSDCGSTVGSATVIPTGGTAPYTYLWSDGNNQTTQTANNLPPGTYSVTVTDLGGCTVTTTATISADLGLMVTLATTSALCNGENSGTVAANVANGTAPFTYAWNNSLPNLPGFTGLSQGTYSVTVTDANGCFGIAEAKVHGASAIMVTPVTEDASCDGNDGRARLDVSGGTPGYSFAWGVPLNNFTNIATGLAPGGYEFTVTDANGCSVSDVLIIGQETDCNPSSCVVTAGTITTTNPTTICAGDGIPDPITVAISGNVGTTSSWIITDNAGNILELPTSNVFDFDGAGFGICQIWNITYNGAINGLTIGQNIANINGCFALSNSITATRQDCTPTCTVTGGTISTTDNTTICAGDGIPDPITVAISGNVGVTSSWIVTDNAGNILELPTSNVFDFDGAGFGTCQIWNITYDGTINGLTIGQNIANINGCFALTNPITVVRQDCTPTCTVTGGMISTMDNTTICAGDGLADFIAVNLTGNTGENTQWVVTDEALNILELPTSNLFNFDGAGFGTCLIWSVSYMDAIGGLVVGQNAGNLTGCIDLSNAIRVVRQDCTPTCTVTSSTISTNDPTVFCVGDGSSDNVSVNLIVGSGDFSRFIITDTTATIIAISSETIYDFETTAPGVCLLWNITYNEGVGGLEIGNQINALSGCFRLSNALTIVRQDCQPDPCLNGPEVILVATDNTCGAEKIATITATAIDGQAPYTYAWSNGSTTADLVNLDAGTYSLTVTDANGCTVTRTASISDGGAISLTIATSNTICSGSNTGSLSATATGGQAPFTYAWSNGGTTADLANLAAGTYNLTVTDANGCTVTSSANISDGGAITVAINTPNTICSDSNTGSLSATVTGGQAPFTYNWSNGGSTQTLTNLAAGTYNLTITDANGCTASTSATILEIADFSVNIISNNRTVCPGEPISLGIAPANPSLTYSWTATGGSFDDATSSSPMYTMMTPGNYDITVVASNGTCTATSTITVTILQGVNLSATISDVVCAGDNNGAITINASSENEPLTYNWDNGIGNIPNPTGLAPGNYNVTITDTTNCSITQSFTIGVTSNLSLDLTSSNLNCNGANNGSITANAMGGVAPITYTWSNGGPNAATQNNLAAGTYSVTATDAMGCAQEATIELTEPTPVFATIVNSAQGQILCPGTSVNLTATPNVATFTYNWTATGGNFDNPNISTPVYTMMMPGNYEITVIISDGTCSYTATTNVIIGTGIDFTVNKTDISCPEETDGRISLNITNGAAPITFAWDGGIGNNPNPTGLAAGTYNLTLTDANNCQATTSVTIAAPNPIDIALDGTNILCNGDANGAVNALVVGGANPLSLAWSTGSNGTGIDNLTPGTYSLTVTDANGCTEVESITLTESPALNVVATGVNIGCLDDGNAFVTASGGTGPYTYLWNDDAAQTTDTAFNLVAGDYSVTVTDANGCQTTSTVSIIATEGISCSIVVLNEIETFNGTEGELGVIVTGGSGNYTYSWNNGGMDSTITNLSTNTFEVTITDDTGCTCVNSLTLLNPAFLGNYVFIDSDSSGTQDIGEPGVEGVTLQLTGTTTFGDMIVRTTQTDENGFYQFQVPPGDYKVTVLDAFGYNFTSVNIGGDDAIDSDFDPAMGMSQVVTLGPNESNLTIDLGLLVGEGCQNVLLGGAIQSDETLCSSDADPTIITNLSFPTGGMGQLEYLWLQSDITMEYYPGHPAWTEIPNSNSPNYDPGVITKTTYFIRCTRRSGCDSYPGESNIVTKTVIDCFSNPAAENLRTTILDGHIDLTWEGKIPYNNGYFIVEKSENGKDFEVCGTIESPISEDMEAFHFMDEAPSFGDNYYRIKTVVPAMQSNFSNIAMAKIKLHTNQKVMVYPNPVQQHATIHFLEEMDEMAQVQIVSGFGQIIKTFEVDTANKKYEVDLSDLPSGMYYLKFNNRALKRFGHKIYKIEE